MGIDSKGPNAHLGLHVTVLLVAGGMAYVMRSPDSLLCLPVAAWAISRIVVNGSGWFLQRATEDAWAAWEGRCYVFDGRRMRLLWDTDAQLFFVADDVFAALDRKLDTCARIKLNARLGGKGLVRLPDVKAACFTQPALEQYLKAQHTEAAKRMSQWLAREIVPVIRRSSERGGIGFKEYAMSRIPPEEIAPISLTSKLRSKPRLRRSNL